MPQVPLPTGFQSTDDFPDLHESLINMMNIGENKLMQRPGIVSNNVVGNGACRGSDNFRDELYQVSGTDLIRVEEDGTKTVLGFVEGSAECATAVGFVHIVVVVKGTGGRGYSYNGDTDTFAEIVDPDYPSNGCSDVAYLDGRYIFTPTDGGPALFSEPFMPDDIGALSFFDAETQPDRNEGCWNYKNRLYLAGSDTMEVFRNVGGSPVPYQRIDGAALDYGLVAGHTPWGDSVAFLGKKKKGNFGMFIVGSGTAPRISNPAVDNLLNNFYTLAELQTCIAQTFEWKGVEVAVFHLPFHTLFYNGVGWSFARSIATFEEKQQLVEEFKTWRVNYITHVYGEYYVGDVLTNDIGILDDVANDYGDNITSGFDTFLKADRDSYFTANFMELDGLVGQAAVGAPESTIGLSVSDDGKNYGPLFYVGLGLIGEYSRRITWEYTGGLGDYESLMAIRIRTTAQVEISGEGLNIDI